MEKTIVALWLKSGRRLEVDDNCVEIIEGVIEWTVILAENDLYSDRAYIDPEDVEAVIERTR